MADSELSHRSSPPGRALISAWLMAILAAALCLIAGYLGMAIAPALGPVAAAAVAAVFIVLAHRRLERLRALAPYSRALLRGDIAEPPADLEGTAAELAAGLGRLAGRVRYLETTIANTTVTLQDLAASVEPTSKTVQEWVGADREQATVLSRSLQTTQTQLAELGERLEAMTLATLQHTEGAGVLESTNRSVGEHVHQLAASVDEVAASIEEMTYSIKEVARNIEELSLAAEQTATSMNQMDSSITEVESNVAVTSQLADEVARDAAKGAESVHHTLEGIEKIRDTVSTAASVISGLGARIQEIGNILRVIEDVAEQTNLLALNAAIIAAQAGEHGRGFAVVADEIKELADKTGASTKEIAALIRAIQEESQNAIEAIAVGERNVHEGVALSRDAEQALAKILDSSKKSTQRFKTIASATVEQARGSKIVADAVERIARSVQQVAAATAEQARGSEQLMHGAERIKGLTQDVESGSRQEGVAIETVLGFVRDLEAQLQSLHATETGSREAWELVHGQLERLVARGESPEAQLEVLFDLSPRLRGEAERIPALSSQTAITIPPAI